MLYDARHGFEYLHSSSRLGSWASTISIPAIAQDTPDVSSCRQFAQEFYRWYVPFTQKDLKYPASDIAIERKSALFDAALLQALKADADAQKKAEGEIVGLDFDPFMGSQDPADHYDIRKVSIRGDTCLVEVWRNSPREKPWEPVKPDVIAELSKRTGRWQFRNFPLPRGERRPYFGIGLVA